MSVCTRGKGGGKEKQRVGLVGVGLALVRFVIAKRCFRCGSSLLSSHKRKKIVCVEVSPQQPIPGHPHSNSLPVPPLGAPLLRASPPPPHPVSPREAEAAAPLLPHCLQFCGCRGRDLLAQVFGILLCRLAGRGVGLAGWALADRFAGRLGWVALPAVSPRCRRVSLVSTFLSHGWLEWKHPDISTAASERISSPQIRRQPCCKPVCSLSGPQGSRVPAPRTKDWDSCPSSPHLPLPDLLAASLPRKHKGDTLLLGTSLLHKRGTIQKSGSRSLQEAGFTQAIKARFPPLSPARQGRCTHPFPQRAALKWMCNIQTLQQLLCFRDSEAAVTGSLTGGSGSI